MYGTLNFLCFIVGHMTLLLRKNRKNPKFFLFLISIKLSIEGNFDPQSEKNRIFLMIGLKIIVEITCRICFSVLIHNNSLSRAEYGNSGAILPVNIGYT